MSKQQRPFRVLSLDGGGMRGIYTATYLDRAAATHAKRRGLDELDLGRAFDLIVGTSTGGIIACALAAGVALPTVIDLYRGTGRRIFRRRLPGLLTLLCDLILRPRALRKGAESLRGALDAVFEGRTLGQVYAERGIALAIPAVEMSQSRGWVFKTRHLANSFGRGDETTLVDVCMATSAAPLYRSLAVVDRADGHGYNVFADGGLWANNPVLVGMCDALDMAEPEQPIEIFCMGTCPLPAGEQIPRKKVNRGLPGWRFGGGAAALSIAAQEFNNHHVATRISGSLDRPCRVIRFPHDKVPAALMQFLGLDDARPAAMDALVNQARTDADSLNSRCSDPADREGRLIAAMFDDAPSMVGGTNSPVDPSAKPNTI